MQYNQATFWPVTNIAEWDINSINSNFTLIQWNMDILSEQENILSFWTPYDSAERYQTALEITDAIYNDEIGLAYHQGIIYAGLKVERDKNYKRINLYPYSEGEYSYLDIKPGSIIYAIDFTKAINDSRRYLVIESPVKYGYNFTVINGLMNWIWEPLNSTKRIIKGPAGASNWARIVNFQKIKPFGSANLLSFKIPLNELVYSPDTDRMPGPYDVFSVRFQTYTFAEGENIVQIPNKSWIASEKDYVNNKEIYYFYLTFLVTSTTSWKNLFNTDEYRLWIW